LVSINKIELGNGSLVKPPQDYIPWAQAFDSDRRSPLINYSGGLEKFFGGALSRESLISFMGPDKTGKSFWLLDVAFRAIKARRRVAYFEVGDLMQDEVLLRLGSRASRIPLEPGTIHIPLEIDSETKQVVDYDERTFTEGLSARHAYKTFRKICRNRDVFRLSCHPNGTISVDGLRQILSDWHRGGWMADVVVIDYADILEPPRGLLDPLVQTDETWKRLRRMSQELHCLVVTASQSNAAAYQDKTSTLGRKHFSGRKTKLAHVNGMIGINYNDEDKKNGVMRLNWVVKRKGKYEESKSVTVAGCLDVAAPAIISVF
jgi:hypothetical protein